MSVLPILLTASFAAAMVFVWTRWFPVQATRVALAVARRLTGLVRRQIVIDDLNVVYLEGGRGETMLLLHGAGADKENFLHVARRLRRRYRVLIPDLPGFGESDKPDDISYRASDQSRRLVAFANALGAERFHLGGNSMGGLIAGVLASEYPDKVLSLWLLAPAGVKAARPSELMRKLAAGEKLPIFARNTAEMRAVIAFATHRAPWMPAFFIDAMAIRQRDHYALNLRIVDELTEGPWLDELPLSRVTMPTLIVWGERDRALDRSGAAVLSALLPDARVVLMPDTGHVPMIEAPAAAVRDYLRFLHERVAAR